MRTRRLDRSYKDKVVEVFRICFDYSSKEGALYLGDDSVWKYVWGMEDRGQLVATYMSIPTKTKIRGIVFEGHYVDDVATMPFHRKGGLARRLFINDAKDCMSKGIDILLLDPFKHHFYRKMGFEVAFDNNDLQFDYALLSPARDTKLKVLNGSLCENEWLCEYINRARNKSWDISRYSEAIDIPAYANTLYMRKNMKAAIAVDKDDVIRAYMLYSTKDRRMTVPCFWFEGLSGLHALKVFLYRHNEQIDSFHMTRVPPDFPIDLLLHSAWQGGSSMQFKDRPSRMLRVIDPLKCLDKAINSHSSRTVLLKIKDPVIKRNDLTLELSGNGARESGEREDLSVLISDLAPLLTGRSDAISLWRMNKLNIAEEYQLSWHSPQIPEAIKSLDELFPPIPMHSAR